MTISRVTLGAPAGTLPGARTSGRRARWLAAVAAGVTVAGAAAIAVAPAAVAATTDVDCNASDLASAFSGASAGDTLSLAPDCTYQISATLTAAVNLTIRGNGATIEPTNVAPQISLLTVNDDVTVDIYHLRFLDGNGGNVDGDGGAIANSGVLKLVHDTFIGNQADDDGGAVYNASTGTVTIIKCLFAHNTADFYGGALASDGSATVVKSLFVRNSQTSATTNDGGGGIADDGSDLTVKDSLFEHNSAAQDGGGLWTRDDSQVTLTNDSWQYNYAGDNGGGIEISESLVTINNGDFAANDADNNGGAISNTQLGQEGGAPVLHGSAKDPEDGTVVNSGLFLHNNAGYEGGAIYTAYGQPTQVYLSRVQWNTAEYGGGYYTDSANLFITFTHTRVNRASDEGGGLFVGTDGFASLAHSDVFQNVAGPDGGGGIYNEDDVSLTQTTILENTPDNCIDVTGCRG